MIQQNGKHFRIIYTKSKLKECLEAVEKQCKIRTQKVSTKHIHQKLMH